MKTQSLQPAKLKQVVPKAALIENQPQNLKEPRFEDYLNHEQFLTFDSEQLMDAKFRFEVDMDNYRQACHPSARAAKAPENSSGLGNEEEYQANAGQMHPGLLLDLFGRPIVINPAFAAITQSALASLLLSYLAYASEEQVEQAPEFEGWIHKTTEEWTEWTGMSRFEQASARKVLTSLGITQEVRAGMPAKLYIRVNFDHLYLLLNSQAQERYAHMKL